MEWHGPLGQCWFSLLLFFFTRWDVLALSVKSRRRQLRPAKAGGLEWMKGFSPNRFHLKKKTCMACHGMKGEGGVGPNLTDNYWLHGGTINDVFKTIKFGVPEKGMQAWEKTYSPSQIKNIASYIKSIAGSNPPNAKAPQGDPFEEKKNESKPATANDSTIVAKK
ncbi:MAG: c-type cytochrome [Chitinophagaceae bacterium]|nr:MAG: c-type cytochrome [Chitinophagaceae bacterium]